LPAQIGGSARGYLTLSGRLPTRPAAKDAGGDRMFMQRQPLEVNARFCRRQRGRAE
jgi:hypothetical protein